MAAREHEPKPVVVDAVLHGQVGIIVEIVLVGGQPLQALGRLESAGSGAVASDRVDRSPAGDGGEPSARPRRHSAVRPRTRRRDECLGDGFLREADVAAHLTRERRHEGHPVVPVGTLDRLGNPIAGAARGGIVDHPCS